MNLRIVTPPTAEPVTVPEASNYLRLGECPAQGDYAMLATLISAARGLVETCANRTLMPTTLRLSLDAFAPQLPIRLPGSPLVAVTALTYVDADGIGRTLDPSAYVVDADAQPGQVTAAYGTAWPRTRGQPNAVQVTYTAGFASAAAVPAPLRLAMLMLVAYWYDNPNAVGASLEEQPLAARSLIATAALPEVY